MINLSMLRYVVAVTIAVGALAGSFFRPDDRIGLGDEGITLPDGMRSDSRKAMAGDAGGDAGPSVHAVSHRAVATSDFLDSIGVNSSFPDRGQPLDRTIEMLRYGGFRWVRAGVEGLSDSGPTTLQTFLELHAKAGVKLSWGLGSGGSDLRRLLKTGKVLSENGALLAFEGRNEPNNWAVTYQGEIGGRDMSWLPVAKLQRDLYQAVKKDPVLSSYPVWSVSEPGGQHDNVGLQFLTIPSGAKTLMPDGTRYADFANVHNYVFHPNSRELTDNKVWNASDPTAESKVDGLHANFGTTWRQHFQGYSQVQLASLPRVTTETGVAIDQRVTEDVQGLNLVNLYLAQFKRGYTYTAVYILRDRVDESGNQSFGFFKPDYSPRKAAVYLHNLTTILADNGRLAPLGELEFAIAGQPDTVHDLLLQRSDGTFQLVIWDERLSGEDKVMLRFGSKHRSVAIYDPTVGTRPVKTLTDVDSVMFALSDHPNVIAIQPE